MRGLRHDDPVGTSVAVVLDDQTIWHTKTRRKTMTLGDHQVVLLEGSCKYYLIKYCHLDWIPGEP